MQFWYHSFSRIFYDASFFVCIFDFYRTVAGTAQKVKFSIKDSFSKCDQIRSFLRVWSYLLKKSLMENLIFCVVKHFFTCSDKYFFWPNKSGGFPIFFSSQPWFSESNLVFKVQWGTERRPYRPAAVLILCIIVFGFVASKPHVLSSIAFFKIVAHV